MGKKLTQQEIEIEIDNLYEKWLRRPCYNPYGIDDEGHWRSKSFALFIIKELRDSL